MDLIRAGPDASASSIVLSNSFVIYSFRILLMYQPPPPHPHPSLPLHYLRLWEAESDFPKVNEIVTTP